MTSTRLKDHSKSVAERMKTKHPGDVCTEPMEEDKRTYDFTTLFLLSLKRRLYDKLRHSCFRLTYRPGKEWSPEKSINANEDDLNLSELSADSSLTDRQYSKPEVFYTGDGRWLSSDWTTVGASSTAKKRHSTTFEKRRRMNANLQEKKEDDHRQITRLGDFMMVQTAIPWFFPWIIAMLTFLILTKPKTQDSKRGRKTKRDTDQLNSAENASVQQRSIGGVSILPTKSSESTLALVSKAESDYQKLKRSPRQVGISSRKSNSPSPTNKQFLTYISPQQRPIKTPPPSPRRSADQLRTSSSSEEDRDLQTLFTDDDHWVSLMERNSEQQCNTPKAVSSPSAKSKSTEDLDVRQPEGLLSLHFSNESKVDVLFGEVVEEASTSSQQDEEDDDELRKVKSCSAGFLTEDSQTRLKKKETTLQRSSKSLPGGAGKARALQMLKAKKAEARRLARAGGSQGSGDFGEEVKSAPGFSPVEQGIAIPETHPMWRFDSMDSTGNENEDYRGESLASEGSRRIESQTSVDSSSSIGFDLEPAMSMQMSNLIRRNTRDLTRAMPGSGDSSIYRWPTISERDSAITQAMSMSKDADDVSDCEEDPPGSEESAEDEGLVALVQTTDIAPTSLVEGRGVSPFSAEVYQRQPITKKPKSAKKKATKETAVGEESIEEKVEPAIQPQTKAKQTKKPPPPPPSKNTTTSSAKVQTTKKSAPPKGKGPAPPPPPPMSRGKGGRGGSGISRAPEVIAMFQAVSKASKDKPKTKHKRRSSKNDSVDSNSKLASEGSGGDALIKEFEQSSRHFAQIQSDVKTYGPKIEKIIEDMAKMKFQSMGEMNAYVYEVDSLLEKFADETAVLKQFNWPSRYYVYREALALWLEIKNRNDKCRNWVHGTRGMSPELTKMKKYMELNIKRLDDIQRTLDSEVKKFKANGIPWDPSIIPKLHEGTMILLQKYMQIVYDEVSRTHKKLSHRENNVQYLTETIRLAFKIHQFVGGFTESCTSLFEKIAEFTRTLNTDL